MVSRSRRSPILLLLAASALAAAPPLAARAQDASAPAAGGQTVTVMVSGQGSPVRGIPVTVAPDNGVIPENWNIGNTKPIAVIPTDATGHAVFANVAPGRYIVTTTCQVPGNWIAGNYATRLELLPGRPGEVTLTLRKGAMVRGKAMQGGKPAIRAEIHSDSPDALMSTCGMMTPSLVDTVTGAFTVTKIPVNATTWVKAELPLGSGTLGVWKDFHFTKADTANVTIEFPRMGANDVGSLVVDIKANTADKPDSGMAQLLQVTPDGKWRYAANFVVGGVTSPVTVKNVPAGSYQLRANALPGSNHWWSSPIDTFHVWPGKPKNYTIKISM